MTKSLLEEYKDYYKVRAARYTNNPNYKYSYQAETKLSDAMQSCNVLEEFKDKIGNLNEKCANALIKDHYIMRKSFYDEMQEDVRVLGPERILENIDQKETALDVASFVSEEENKNIK